MPVMFYVQHLLGVGHVYRASRIAGALQKAGLEVHLVWGGTRIPDVEPEKVHIHFLPAVRSANADFNQLVHEDGTPFSESDCAARSVQLLELYRQINPALLITEAFPFGRRQMLFELMPLLDIADKSDPRPLVVSSIRDIMQEGRKEKRVRESVELLDRYFDLVLVHGDPSMIRIEQTLQGIEEFSGKVRYTGIVTPPAASPAPQNSVNHDVVVSAGGGAFGRELLECALLAKPLCPGLPGPWLVTAGSQIPEADFAALQNSCPKDVELVRFVPDLLQKLMTADVSVSHAGYNTVADILRAGCRSVLYPHTGGRETEQLRRSRILQELGFAQFIAPGELTPSHLAAAIEKARLQEPVDHRLDLEGADGSAKVLIDEMHRRNRPE